MPCGCSGAGGNTAEAAPASPCSVIFVDHLPGIVPPVMHRLARKTKNARKTNLRAFLCTGTVQRGGPPCASHLSTNIPESLEYFSGAKKNTPKATPEGKALPPCLHPKKFAAEKVKQERRDFSRLFLLVRLSFGVWQDRHAQALDPVRFQKADERYWRSMIFRALSRLARRYAPRLPLLRWAVTSNLW